MALNLSGVATGFDWMSVVDQLTEVERTPQTRMRNEQSRIQQRNNAYGSIKTQLQVLQNRITALKAGTVFGSRQAQVSNSSAATATAGTDAPLGTYAFAVSQRATSAKWVGASDAGAPLNTSDDVSGVVLSSAGFSTAVTAGTFTVNGETVTIATSDTLQQVFDKISTATSGAVTGSYNHTTDKITLSSGSAIVLGSATDTSNFLQVARLANNGTGTVTSSAALGGLKLSSALNAANFSTAISDGGSGAGEFKINGVSISFSASSDSLSGVIARINNSAAGVTASYDAVNDQLTLTNKTTGDVGIALQDVTGNFLAATKLSTGTLTTGQDLLYTINGGPTLSSHSNTITEASSGIAGLTVNVLEPQTSEPTVTTTVTETTATGGDSATGREIIRAFGGGGGDATRITTASDHAFQTGDTIRLRSTGTLPSMVNDSTTYYVRRISATQISLHTTLADAVNNDNAVNFGNNPPYTGNAYVVPYDPFYTAPGSTSTTTTTTTSGEGDEISFTVSVNSDSNAIKTAIADLVTEYNKTQSLIDTLTASSTDSKGKVTAGTLAGERDAFEISRQLRGLIYGEVSGISGLHKQLASLGYASNGNDNTLTLSDSADLDDAITNDLGGVKNLFADSTNGLAVKLSNYFDRLLDEDDGSLVVLQNGLTKQSKDIDTQVADQERIVQMTRAQLIASFTAMETAQANINQQLEYLTRTFGSS